MAKIMYNGASIGDAAIIDKEAIDATVGDVSKLSTSSKTTVVDAINEMARKLTVIESLIEGYSPTLFSVTDSDDNITERYILSRSTYPAPGARTRSGDFVDWESFVRDGKYTIENGVIESNANDAERIAFLQNFTEIVIPEDVKEIGHEAFAFGGSGSSSHEASYVKKITLPDTLEKIGDFAFGYCYEVEELKLPDSCTSFGLGAFRGLQSLKSIVVPYGTEELSGTFLECLSLTQVTLPDTLTKIDTATFCECTSLEEIRIPDSVTYIDGTTNDWMAFSRCDSLTIIHYSGTATGAPWGAANATVVP